MQNLEDHIVNLPLWQGKPRLTPLLGGLSNLSFFAEDASGRYVVRYGRDYPFHHVFREREIVAAHAAHAAGFAPEVVYSEPGLMVSRFIEGKVFAEADVRANIDRIADIVRRFHTEMPARISGPGFMFWTFHVSRDYALTLKASSNPHTARLAELMALNDEFERAQVPLPIIFGHHDFLPANIIDDGRRLWLIDFEYAGFGTAMFDLAGLASNSGFDAAQSRQLLETYFGGPASGALMKSHAAMQCASLLREALWAVVSEMFLTAPGADYAAYADENFTRFDAALAAYRSSYPEA